MSGEVVGWAMKQITGSPAAKLVLAKLADNSNEQGICWPSIDLIVRHTELAQSTVYKHLAALEELGLISPIDIVVKGDLRKAFQLAIETVEIPPDGKNKKRIPPGGKAEIPPDGTDFPSGREQIPPDGIPYKEEPSLEPSENRHSLAEREKDAEPLSGKGEGPDPKAWAPAIMEAYRSLPNADRGASEELAEAAWLAIPWGERPTTDELIACIQARGRELIRLNATRPPSKPQMVQHPKRWLKERNYQPFLAEVRAQAQQRKARSSPPAHEILPAALLETLYGAALSTAEIDAWFDDAIFDLSDSELTVWVEKEFKRNWIESHFASRLERSAHRNVRVGLIGARNAA